MAFYFQFMRSMISKATSWQDSPWFIACLFMFFIGPFALDFHMHYPDEMYYSDAAVTMTQNHDFLTTYLGSGELRFKKPILTYWGVLAGFELFGISPFSSRVFFLLAGALTIVLTYKIADTTFADRKIAVLSSLIIASHPVLIFSSTRSIPDILLALCITLSAWGFAGLLKHGDGSPKKYLWIMYIGLGLAFEVKGLPAVAIGGLGLLYLLLNPWKRISLKTLLYLPAIIVGLAIAIFWFLSMYYKFGAMYLDSFLSDQVGERVAGRALVVIINFLLAIVLMIVMFFPWGFLAFKNFNKNVRNLIRENKAFFYWVLTWVAGIIIMSALVFKFYERYLLPVTPLAAVGLAWLLTQRPSGDSGKALKVFLYFFFGINAIVLAAALFLNLGMEASWFVYLGMALSGVLLVVMFGSIRNKRDNYFWLSVSFMLIFFNLSFVTYQLSLPHQGTQLRRFVQSNDIPKGSKIAFVGHLHTGSKIRIGLGKDYYMTDFSRETYLENLEQFDYSIVEEDVKNKLDGDLYEIQTASLMWDLKLFPEIMTSIIHGNTSELLESTGKRYYWVQKK